MDLSKAFDSIPHDLLIAKMHAYGFSLDAVTFFYSYLKRQCEVHKVFSKLYYLEFLKVQYLGHFSSTYLLMNYISGYQKQTC